VGADAPGALKLLAAASLVALAMAPFAAAAALRQD
jgi:heme exporter protein B